jgi:hypothetical protein
MWSRSSIVRTSKQRHGIGIDWNDCRSSIGPGSGIGSGDGMMYRRRKLNTMERTTSSTSNRCNYCSNVCMPTQSFPKHWRLNQVDASARYLINTNTATRATSSDTKKAQHILNPIEKEEEERLLENVEEIVDVPSSAFEDVIDRSKYTDPVGVLMPDLGTSLGNTPSRFSSVKQWFFKPGDIIQHEDVLCDIETPDFTFGMETDDEEITIMGDILVPAGQPVADGTILCYTFHEQKGSSPKQLPIEAVTIEKEDDDDEDDDDVEKKEMETEKRKS